MEDRTNGSAFNPTSIEVMDRDGNSINANISRSDRFSWIEIPNSSEIRIRIRNWFSSSYEYDYFIHDLTSVPSLSLGSYAEGTLAANESRIWRVALTAGRSITLDRDLSVMSPSLGISLFGPQAESRIHLVKISSTSQESISLSRNHFPSRRITHFACSTRLPPAA
jgi:hypothetical protein